MGKEFGCREIGMCSQTAQLRQLLSPGQVSERQLGAGYGRAVTLIITIPIPASPFSRDFLCWNALDALAVQRESTWSHPLWQKKLRVLRDQLG